MNPKAPAPPPNSTRKSDTLDETATLDTRPADLEAAIAQILGQLSLQDKLTLCAGASFWHTAGLPDHDLPAVQLADGPHGLRKQPQDQGKVGLMESIPATCFPTAAALACAWDHALIESVGAAMGKEARQAQVAMLLGPGANIKRHPHGGRNFEYFSEDPFLSGTLAAAMIQGIQSTGIGACIKHFVANNQEYHRQVIDAIVDPRALHEIYLDGFRRAIHQSQPWAVMTAYNQVNGQFCSEHRPLLQEILRDRWGFQGLVVSDWGATNDRVQGLLAGMDLEMPGSHGAHQAHLTAAIDAGTLPLEIIDTSARRVLQLLSKAAETHRQAPSWPPVNFETHHALARHASANSTVLLKHDPAILPLQPKGHIAVIGEFARQPRFQGNGSSRVVPTRIDNAWDCLWEACSGADAALGYAPGYRIEQTKPSPALLDEAKAVAAKADTVLLFLGLPEAFESEGLDRPHLQLPAQQLALLEAITSIHQRVCVILSIGAPVLMPWIDRVQAILTGYLGGQAAGAAIVDVLLGHNNPCGKLAESFPRDERDCPATHYFPGTAQQVQYRESIFVGYRYYDSFDKDVLFPFGHGLSYTQFDYQMQQVSHQVCKYEGDLEAPAFRITCTLHNSGQAKGAEVAQLYLHFPDSPVTRARQVLKGFAKVMLKPGQQQDVRFVVPWRELATFDTHTQQWQLHQGTCEIRIGSSSRDIRLQAQISMQVDSLQVDTAQVDTTQVDTTQVDSTQVDSTQVDTEQADTVQADTAQVAAKAADTALVLLAGYTFVDGALSLSDAAFARLLGHEIPRPLARRPFHLNSTLGEVKEHWLGRLLYWIARRAARQALPGSEHTAFREALVAGLDGTPLRSLALMSEGRLRFRHLQRLLKLMNRTTR